MLRSYAWQSKIRDYIDEIFKVQFKGHGICHGLISKAVFLPFKQDYDNVRLSH